jgi:ferrous iron transport protein B
VRVAQAAEEESNMAGVIALTGNPNTGKTTIFNALTGSSQKVGNWPGVTVERKEGRLKYGEKDLHVVDLPGIYSLGVTSVDEQIAAEFLLLDKPELAVIVADASNIERSLYLVIQLLEMGQNSVIALNMNDTAKSKGVTIDTKALEKMLGTPVISTVAKTGSGIEDLKQQVLGSFREQKEMNFAIPYGERINPVLEMIEKALDLSDLGNLNISPSLASIKLAEGDALVWKSIEGTKSYNRVSRIIEQAGEELEKELGYDLQTAIIERRWGFISGLVAEVVKKDLSIKERLTLSDRIDRVVTHRVLGLPLFLAITWAIFKLTYILGDPASDWLDGMVGTFGETLAGWIAAQGYSSLVSSFLVDGVVGGVGSVVVFFPYIFLLFAFIAVLEDSGYMSRGAFVMDRIMHLLGLHGKSFIPMLIGFGCNVPAIMGTRILERPRDRMITMMVLPFMSCSARLPVFALFSAAFFPAHASTVLFSLYVIGIATAVFSAKLLGSTLFKGESSQLVMELPPYHFPTIRGVLKEAWQRGSLFLKKAGTFIFLAVILVWVLANLPAGVEYASQDSLVGKIGQFIAPVFKPAGFGFWQAGVALFFGFIAKEIVVGTFGTLFGVGEAGIQTILPTLFTPLSAYAFMIMTLLYVPCVAVLAAVKRETNSWKWPIFMVLYTTGIAWILSVLVYQSGILFGW